jgi:hypothetical protein
MNFEVDPIDNVLRLVPKRFSYSQSKAKVAAWDNRLDVNVQVTISAVVADKDGKRSSVDIVRSDFPMGRTPSDPTSLWKASAFPTRKVAGFRSLPSPPLRAMAPSGP